MHQPRPSLDGLIRLLAVASVVMFALSAVSIAYTAGRHSGGPVTADLTSVRTVD